MALATGIPAGSRARTQLAAWLVNGASRRAGELSGSWVFTVPRDHAGGQAVLSRGPRPPRSASQGATREAAGGYDPPMGRVGASIESPASTRASVPRGRPASRTCPRWLLESSRPRFLDAPLAAAAGGGVGLRCPGPRPVRGTDRSAVRPPSMLASAVRRPLTIEVRTRGRVGEAGTRSRAWRSNVPTSPLLGFIGGS